MQIKESLPVGTILDSGVRKYVIKSVLGQGGFGITYLATSTIQVGNIPAVMQFAIKEHYISTMNKRQGTSVAISNENNTAEIKESIDSFLVEAQRLNRLSLNHSGIVRVNESFRANGTAYYVMEYIKGQNLREYVKRSPQGRLSEDEALKMFRPIVETIEYLHENKVTHLDIKPDNILIRENGEPVVIDFGLSKHYSSKGTPTSAIKAIGCSAGYSPMEQYVGITTFTPEADIYALGATLLYVLTGKDPMISTEINEDIIRRSIPQDVSQQTTNAIVHAMEKLKENRTHNVSDFFSRIELLEQNNVDNSTDNNKTRKLKNPKQTLNREKPSASLKPREAIKLASSYWKYLKYLIGVCIVAISVGVIIKMCSTISITQDSPMADDSVRNIVVPGDSNDMMVPIKNLSKEEQAANPVKEGIDKKDVAKDKRDEQTNENKEKIKELSDKELFAKAKSNNDWATIEKLGNKGYASAYYELARHYYNIGNEQMCKKWAERAVAANVKKMDAERLLEDLK